MLYDNDNPITQLIGVERMNWTGSWSTPET